MAAQTPYPIKLSSLIKVCNIDGKDRILPLIEADEKYGEQMQQMQQQMEQMQAQMQQMQAEKQNLQKGLNIAADNLNIMGNRRGNGGQANNEPSAVVEAARNTLGQQTGSPLPT